MLEGLRAVQNTWIGKAVIAVGMGLIVVSFVIWGIGDIFRGIGTNQVAKVGNVEISTVAYRQAYQNELQNLQARLKRPITNEEAHAKGIDSQVLSRMISDAVLDDRVQTLGLALGDAQMAKAIIADPAFADPSGNFDRNRFNYLLRDQGYTEQSFVREQRHVYLRQELVQALVGGLVVPAAALDAVHRFGTETRSLDYVILPAAVVEPIPPPDETTLKTFYDAHKKGFDAPEYRKLVVLTLSPSLLAKPAEVSDADARKLYDQVKDARFNPPGRRLVQQIVFPNAQEAEAASAKIKAGTSFADLVKERKLDSKDVDLGSVTKEQIFDHAVADAAFSLPLGATSEPVKGSFGTVLVHVEAPAAQSFEDVKEQLKQEIATRRASDQINGLHDKIENARSSGQPLAEAAKAVGLEARTIDAVDAQGSGKDGKPIEGLADRDALVKAAFASDVGVDNDIVQGSDGSMTWFEVAAVDPAHSRPLDEVKPAVEAAWHKDEVAKRLTDKAADLVKSLESGKTIQEVAAANGNLPVKHSDDAKRGGAADLSSEAVAQVFDGPVGKVGSAPQGADARILFKVTGSTVPPLDPKAPQSAQLDDRYRAQLAEDILGTYLAHVGAAVGVKINQTAVRSAAGAT